MSQLCAKPTFSLFDDGDEAEILLTEAEVAAACRLDRRTLQGLINQGLGPDYLNFGPKLRRYRPSVVRSWARSRVELSIKREP
jgi:hypothetical protein